MKTYIVAVLALTGMTFLAGCSALTSGVTTNAADCAAALVATGSIDPIVLGAAAAGNSGCLALASDAVKALIADVGKLNLHARQIQAQQVH